MYRETESLKDGVWGRNELWLQSAPVLAIGGLQRRKKKKKKSQGNPGGGHMSGISSLGSVVTVSGMDSRHVPDRSQRRAAFWVDLGPSDGQVGVCVGGRGLWARTASSLFGNGGGVAVKTGQDTSNTHTLMKWVNTDNSGRQDVFF